MLSKIYLLLLFLQEELRARRPRYQKNAIATNLSQAQAPVASQIPPVNPANAGHVGLPMGHLPAGMMIPAYLQPHMQLGMGGLLRGPHMPHMPGKCKIIGNS